MPRPWRIRYAGAKYHVTSRGNGRGVVFVDLRDWERFLEQLQAALELDGVILYAYALMPNHFHLLIETPLGNIQKFMQRLNTAYGMYFRFKKNRPGHCFQGRYGAKIVGGDDYLVRVTRYIHLNPVKTKQSKNASIAEKRACLNGYKWSSYRGYAGLDDEEEFIDYRWRQLMGRRREGANISAYRKYVESMLSTEDAVLKETFENSSYAIGDEEFRAGVEEGLKEKRLIKGVYGRDIAFADKSRKIPLNRIESVVANKYGVKVPDLRKEGRIAGIGKAVALELCCQFSGMTQRAVAAYFEYGSESSVGKQRQMLAAKMKEDAKLSKQFASLKEVLLKA